MKVATWQGEGRFTIDAAPEPVAGPGQVVVAVHAAGICGTDVHATQGLFPWKPPLVLGHEYTGIVTAVGRGVSPRLVGRTVACEPSYGCGTCAACGAGRISQCPAATRVGGFAERVALPARGGADVVCEAVGKPDLVAQALTLVKATGVVQLVGVSPKDARLPLDLWDVHFREIRIHGAFGRGTAFRRALALLPRLDVQRLVTARFALEDIAEAFAHASAGRGAKTMVVSAG